MKRWTLLKTAAKRPNTLNSINLQKQALWAIFKLATGNVIGEWNWFIIAGKKKKKKKKKIKTIQLLHDYILI